MAKARLPSRGVIIKHWREWLERRGIDLRHPCCWACGRTWSGAGPISNADPPWAKITGAWDRASLERHHIIPEALGGPSDPPNLFLLCRECHDLAPSLKSKRPFFLWARKQSYWQRRTRDLHHALGTFYPSDPHIVEDLSPLMASPAFLQWYKEHCYSDSDDRVPPRLTGATIAGAISLYVTENAEHLLAEYADRPGLVELISEGLDPKVRALLERIDDVEIWASAPRWPGHSPFPIPE